MAEPSELERLARHRRRLIGEADQLRYQIARDVDVLRPVIGWIERGIFVGRSLRSTWPVVGGLAAFVMTRKTGSWWRKAGKLWSFWRVLKKGAEIWTRFSGK